MSTLGRIGATILSVLLFSPPAPAAAPEPSAGDRLLAREATIRVDRVHALIRSLTGLDDALIESGHENTPRHHRINRLIALDAGWDGSDFDSTAILAAVLGELSGDPDIRDSRLYPDVANARAFAMQRLVAGLAATRLPASGDLLAMQRLLDDPAEAGPDSTPVPIPSIPEEETRPGAFLLEEPSVSVPAPGPVIRTFRFLPGSRTVLAGDGGDRLFLVDLERGGAAQPFANALAEPPPDISASGEYVALAAGAGGATELRLVRRGTGAAPKTLFRSESGAVSFAFHPRDLRLAAVNEGLTIYDLTDGTDRRLSGHHGSIRWSPDGSHLALIEPGAIAGEVHLRVFESDSGAQTLDAEFPGTPPVWYADSRSLTSLPCTPNPDGLAVAIERRTVDGRGPDRVPLFNAAPGAVVEGPAWSPDGRWAALRVSRAADVAGGFTGSAFLHPLSVVRVVHFDVPDSAGYDPPAAYLPEFAWHPSGRWYAARQEFAEGSGLWLHDVARGDAIRLGGPTAARPAFSPDGRRVLWVERDAAGDRFVYRDLQAVHENVPRGRAFAAEGARALNGARFEEAARAFRNAARLAPAEPRALQGLGRAQIGAAFSGPFSPRKAAAIEAAVRTFGRALGLDGASHDIRVDFLDASGRLAWLQGKMESRRLVDIARTRLAAPPPAGEAARRRYGAEVREALVEAILWDPGNEYARILLDGIMARFPAEGS